MVDLRGGFSAVDDCADHERRAVGGVSSDEDLRHIRQLQAFQHGGAVQFQEAERQQNQIRFDRFRLIRKFLEFQRLAERGECPSDRNDVHACDGTVFPVELPALNVPAADASFFMA